MVMSLILALSRAISSSRVSRSCSFRALIPGSSTRSRKWDSRSGGTFNSRDTISSASPRKRRCTASSLLFAEKRPTGPVPTAPPPALWARAGAAGAYIAPDFSMFSSFMLYLRLIIK